jgi:hypothetical protein
MVWMIQTKALKLALSLLGEGQDWLFAVNPILDKKLSKNKDETPDLDIYGSALFRREGIFKSIGLEYYQALGPYRNFSPK